MNDNERELEITTAVSFKGLSEEDVTKFAKDLREAFLTVFEDHTPPTLRKYAVEAQQNRVVIGFRFVGIDPNSITRVAEELLNDAISRLSDKDHTQAPKMKRSSTLLVGV